MFSGVTSSARSPSQTKMMTLRAAGPPCCGAAGPPASASTTDTKTIKETDALDHRAPHRESSAPMPASLRPVPQRAQRVHPRLLLQLHADLLVCAADVAEVADAA